MVHRLRIWGLFQESLDSGGGARMFDAGTAWCDSETQSRPGPGRWRPEKVQVEENIVQTYKTHQKLTELVKVKGLAPSPKEGNAHPEECWIDGVFKISSSSSVQSAIATMKILLSWSWGVSSDLQVLASQERCPSPQALIVPDPGNGDIREWHRSSWQSLNREITARW